LFGDVQISYEASGKRGGGGQTVRVPSYEEKGLGQIVIL